MKTPLLSRLSAWLAAGALSAAAFAAEPLPHWPLQQHPGPDGNPQQNPATYPKSRAPFGSPHAQPVVSHPDLEPAGPGEWRVAGKWSLQEVIKVADTAHEISIPGYKDQSWYAATVPGTVLTTLVDRGVYPEPTWGLNNMAIPESLNRADYWYRAEFDAPADAAQRTATLTFNGVNYSAEIWMNGTRLGEIRGAFMRGMFDVTRVLRPGKANAIAVRLSPVPHPGIPHEESLAAGAGPNGGTMTYDGPNFFCTEGWDWIPGIRDRCAGLWQDVVLSLGGPVTLGDVQVITHLPLPDISQADLAIDVPVQNRTDEEQTFTVRGKFEGAEFEQSAKLAPHTADVVHFQPKNTPQLHLDHPRLWWPNGYGKPELYHLDITVADSKGATSDEKRVRFGVREVTYELSALDGDEKLGRYELEPTVSGGVPLIDKRHMAIRQTTQGWVPTLGRPAGTPGLQASDDTASGPTLVIKVNGVRVVCKGGNWGLDEALKRVSRERMEPYLRMERDANLTMVRNWCGQNTEETFFDLCDEYGLMVWSDFWASTQDWNEQPGDMPLWLANAADVIKRFRNHPSIVIWCGRNEGVPPPVLNEGLDELVRALDGTRYYQPTSNNVSLLPSGPWTYDDPGKFFTEHGKGFTTELGLPCAPTADAIRAMMAPADTWPISDAWAYHDWHQKDHGEVQSFMAALDREYGPATGLDDFCRKAQMLNYVAHRALFEGLNANLWHPAGGRLIWMSHPTWPSTEWQLYSSDYDPNGAYFGAKKACEPLHVQLNWNDHEVVVTNTTLAAVRGAKVTAEVFDVHGRRLGAQSLVIDAGADVTTPVLRLDENPVANLPLYFVRLELRSATGERLSDNFYWETHRPEDHRALNDLPAVTVQSTVTKVADGKEVRIQVVVKNPAATPALMIKPTLRRPDGSRILPAFASDGYFSLLGGEERHFTIEATYDGPAEVTFDGWNANGKARVE